VKLTLPMFTTPSYGDRTLNDLQRCVNLYPEKTATGWKLLSLPGLELLDSVANNAACRGAYCASNGNIYSAHGTKLYQISLLGVDTEVGDIAEGAGLQITWADNGVYLMMVDGQNGYVVTLADNTFAQIVDVDFTTTPTSVTYQNNRFVVAANPSGAPGRFYLSAIDNPSSWTSLDFANANYSGDAIFRTISVGANLIHFGPRTIEPWYYTGAADFPWERITGSTHNVGLRGTLAVATWEDSVFFLASNINGMGSFYRMDSGVLRPISTPAIESKIAPMTSQHLAYSFCWKSDTGHVFFETTFPFGSDRLTLVYDATSDAWLEASSNISSVYSYHRPRIIVNRSLAIASAAYPPLAFDSQDGKVYKVSSSYNSENGTALQRIRVFGPLQAGALRMFHQRIRFILEVDHDSSASYTLSATLEWTDDGGLSWSTARTLEKAVTSGTTGQLLMLSANRLGSSRQRYYRLTFTGPAAHLVLQSAELDYDLGVN
jgi:hypothetical protein